MKHNAWRSFVAEVNLKGGSAGQLTPGQSDTCESGFLPKTPGALNKGLLNFSGPYASGGRCKHSGASQQ